MNKKFIASTILFGLLALVLVFVFVTKDIDQVPVSEASQEQEKIKIAACPTCYEMTKSLDKTKY